MINKHKIVSLTLIAIALSILPATAAVLVDINADGTNRDASEANFEAAMSLAVGELSGSSLTTFDLNGSNVTTPNFDQTVDNIRIQVNNGTTTIFGDADGWFGGATSPNNLLEDGLFMRHTGTDPAATITLSGTGLDLAPFRRYELSLFAGRSQGHETLFRFNPSAPLAPAGGVSIDTDPPVIGGDETLGTAQFTFATGEVPTALVLRLEALQHVNGNQDAVFSGFALREVGTATVPEPGTTALLVTGILMISGLRRRLIGL
jgi:hypothetical protein